MITSIRFKSMIRLPGGMLTEVLLATSDIVITLDGECVRIAAGEANVLVPLSNVVYMNTTAKKGKKS